MSMPAEERVGALILGDPHPTARVSVEPSPTQGLLQGARVVLSIMSWSIWLVLLGAPAVARSPSTVDEIVRDLMSGQDPVRTQALHKLRKQVPRSLRRY